MLQDALFMEKKRYIFPRFYFNKTVGKEVAEICKKYNPKATLRETNDEIPNLGFSLSNKNFKNWFKFLLCFR